MGRGVSSGGGQSSLGYLFGSGEPANNNPQKPAKSEGNAVSSNPPPENGPTPAPQAVAGCSPPQAVAGSTPAGNPGNVTNNYFRADGQNCGNFITDRPSTKVHSAPGGSSSLNYLFGSGGN
ncbi:protein SPIRAL1-like 1 [Syzygium oleosum]|uniref:protein SPIRAL1-like 1 n=1 Tax=Syzygium oleosum TaxID=219896 RepID=UPI0011D20ECF|nr:protein SPIRAL1-like 1 [Syzygium oleosum]XP_030452269.1 protein SPIRAL1-like 1 [Syzygium oleosum]XP_056175823.1 protein SPIRAL1-like 1 [Syzygium oleosum]